MYSQLVIGHSKNFNNQLLRMSSQLDIGYSTHCCYKDVSIRITSYGRMYSQLVIGHWKNFNNQLLNNQILRISSQLDIGYSRHCCCTASNTRITSYRRMYSQLVIGHSKNFNNQLLRMSSQLDIGYSTHCCYKDVSIRITSYGRMYSQLVIGHSKNFNNQLLRISASWILVIQHIAVTRKHTNNQLRANVQPAGNWTFEKFQ